MQKRIKIELPKSFKPTAIAFKDEGEENGMIIGPIWWMGRKGKMEAIAPDANGTQWTTLQQARKLAKAFNLNVVEV